MTTIPGAHPVAAPARWIPWTAAAGLLLGLALAAAPLMLLVVALATVMVLFAREHVGAADRRALTTILVLALATRAVVVTGLAIWSIPVLSAQSGGVLLGDEGYLFERSLRTRDVMLGHAVTKLDYVMAYETYANTKHTAWVTWLQTIFGPSPYSIRLLNGAMFVAAACVMFRLAYTGFGGTAASVALAALLFLPSMLFWSVSLLKDSMFFLFTAVAFASVVAIVRGTTRGRIAGAVSLGVALWLISDMRPAAVLLTGGGLALGLLLRWALSSKRRLAAAAAVVAVGGTAIATSDRASTRVLRELTVMSQQHFGHASTRGHAYRTLDAEFYRDYLGTLGGEPLKVDQAARYVARSAVAFVTVPLPWQARTRGEVASVPEQMLWYAMVAFALVGIAAAYRRDALLASLLVGYIGTMSAALALINGNVGTLVRLRTLVSRFVVWIAAVGVMVAVERMAQKRSRTVIDERGPMAGRFNVVDALFVALALFVLPLGYVCWLLFQPATPRIHHVERSEITSAEERVAAGEPIRLKVKVRGEHLTPMLRAYIGSVPAIGFTFETPESGDVIIGANVPPGTHDLILYDGHLEVARAPSAVTIGGGIGVPADATVRVRLTASAALQEAVRDGDRDIRPLPPDGRAATVQRIEHKDGDALVVVIRLGAYREADGWRYQSHSLIAGRPFTLVTERYSVAGEILEVLIHGD